MVDLRFSAVEGGVKEQSLSLDWIGCNTSLFVSSRRGFASALIHGRISQYSDSFASPHFLLGRLLAKIAHRKKCLKPVAARSFGVSGNAQLVGAFFSSGARVGKGERR